MSAINDGGPAFPVYTPNMPVEGSPGLSIRDYFAGLAMPVLLADAIDGPLPDEHWRIGIAYDAYRMADAMLIARSARPAGDDK